MQPGLPRGVLRATRRLKWPALGLAALSISELGLRAIGLGHPILMKSHPTIEYLAVPNQSVRRFGHLIEYNQFSMRSPPVGRSKANPNELRLLVIGDSVINCGATLDQSDLATTLLAKRLPPQLKRPVVTLNVSAGSWGPQNQLAYLEEFGLFDADLAVIEVSTHDLSDVPQFGPLPPTDTQTPLLAIGEAISRYGLPLIDSWFTASPPVPPSTAAAAPTLEALIVKLKAAGLPTLLLYHFTRPELARPPTGIAEVARVQDMATRHGAAFKILHGDLKKAQESGDDPYLPRDTIHTSKVGQQIISNAIEAFVLESATSIAKKVAP